MGNAIKVGVVGCGMIADTYLQNLQTLFRDALTVQGVFDRNPQTAARRAAQYGIPRCYDRYEQMLDDPDIDLVLNLTVPAAHYHLTRQALLAGKHVYTEKPLALNGEEGRTLLAQANRQGVRLGSAPDVPLGALVQTARALADSGAIGRIIGASAHLVKPGVETWHPNPAFLYQAGGGPLLDMGPYYLTALLHIVGPFSEVTAMDTISFPTRTITSQPHYGETISVQVPTYVNALLRFDSGGLASFTATFDVQKSQLPFLEIYGSEGSLTLSDPNQFGGIVELAKSGQAYAPAALSFPYDSNCRGLGLWEMAQAIQTGEPSRVDGCYALHILEVMDAIDTSARTGQRITLPQRCGRPAAMPCS